MCIVALETFNKNVVQKKWDWQPRGFLQYKKIPYYQYGVPHSEDKMTLWLQMTAFNGKMTFYIETGPCFFLLVGLPPHNDTTLCLLTHHQSRMVIDKQSQWYTCTQSVHYVYCVWPCLICLNWIEFQLPGRQKWWYLALLCLIVCGNNPCRGLAWPCTNKESVSISDKTSYSKLSQRLETANSLSRIIWSLWNLTGFSAAVLQRCLSNFTAML